MTTMTKGTMSKLPPRLAAAAAASVLALIAGPSAGGLIGVDFGARQSAGFSGSEPQATVFNSGFGAADVWNNLQLPSRYEPAEPAATFANLLDSSGAETSIGLRLSGGAIKADDGVGDPSDALRVDYIIFNSIDSPGPTLFWTIFGLVEGTAFDLIVYSGNSFDSGDWLIHIVGSGIQPVFAQGGTAYFANLQADSRAMINGWLSPLTDEEVTWAGFQLWYADSPADVPEPGTLALFAGGLAALGGAKRRRLHPR